MKYQNSINIKVAAILRSIGSKDCLITAESLENTKGQSDMLNLRNLGLTSSDIITIANTLSELLSENKNAIRSISFSYNYLLGDRGAIALAKALPYSICEIGLVNCGIGDSGGRELLKWAKNAEHLRMLCIEQNDFSENLKMEFRNFSNSQSKILVVV